MIVIRKLTLYLLVIIFVLAGCSKSIVESSAPKNNAPTLTPTNIPKELFINPDDKTSFLINGELVKVTDETSSVNSITNLEWIDDSRIGIEGHINPSLGYFTIYNIQTKQFEYSVYGTNFVWDKHDIQSLIYIECPPHFADIGNAEYKLKDYTDMTLFESSNELRDLEYENGTIRFSIIDKEENKTSKTITKKMIEDIKKQYNVYKKIAWEALDQSVKNLVIEGWQKATLQTVTQEQELCILPLNKTHTTINIKGREMIVVTFPTKDQELYGNIIIYIDPVTKKAIGMAPLM